MGSTYDAVIRDIPTPCRTPGAVYSTAFNPNLIALTISLPVAFFPDVGRMPKSEQRRIAKSLHVALLPAVEALYRDNWDKMANQYIPRAGSKKLPARWDEI